MPETNLFTQEFIESLLAEMEDRMAPLLLDYGYMTNGYESYISGYVTDLDSDLELKLPSGYREKLTDEEWDQRVDILTEIAHKGILKIAGCCPKGVVPSLHFHVQDADFSHNVETCLDLVVHGLELNFCHRNFLPDAVWAESRRRREAEEKP